jgi:hypothetical protein
MYIRGGEVYDDEEIYDIDEYDEDDKDDYLEKDDYSLSYDDIISIVFLDRMNVRKITLSY